MIEYLTLCSSLDISCTMIGSQVICGVYFHVCVLVREIVGQVARIWEQLLHNIIVLSQQQTVQAFQIFMQTSAIHSYTQQHLSFPWI